MNQLILDTSIRAALAQKILTALENAAPGSLAGEQADAYSDVDVFWEVTDELFQASIDGIAATLANAGEIASLRPNRDFQYSDRRRLIFVQFEGMPLFWRADIDIFARSDHRDFEYDLHNAAAKGNDWSLTHSALMNAIAAIKALLRCQEEIAKRLLNRGFERIGRVIPEGGPQEQILELTKSIVEMDPTQGELTQRIIELHEQVFGQTRTAE